MNESGAPDEEPMRRRGPPPHTSNGKAEASMATTSLIMAPPQPAQAGFVAAGHSAGRFNPSDSAPPPPPPILGNRHLSTSTPASHPPHIPSHIDAPPLPE